MDYHTILAFTASCNESVSYTCIYIYILICNIDTFQQDQFIFHLAVFFFISIHLSIHPMSCTAWSGYQSISKLTQRDRLMGHLELSTALTCMLDWIVGGRQRTQMKQGIWRTCKLNAESSSWLVNAKKCSFIQNRVKNVQYSFRSCNMT